MNQLANNYVWIISATEYDIRYANESDVEALITDFENQATVNITNDADLYNPKPRGEEEFFSIEVKYYGMFLQMDLTSLPLDNNCI
jgi:hypothetical protein